MGNLSDSMFALPSKGLTLLAIMLGYVLIDDLEWYDQSALGNFIILVGQVLVTNASEEQRLSTIKTNKKIQQLQQDVQELHYEIQSIRNSNN